MILTSFSSAWCCRVTVHFVRLFLAWEQLDKKTRKYIKEVNLISEIRAMLKGILKAGSNMTMESRLKVWWNAFHEEYDRDENNM